MIQTILKIVKNISVIKDTLLIFGFSCSISLIDNFLSINNIQTTPSRNIYIQKNSISFAFYIKKYILNSSKYYILIIFFFRVLQILKF